MKNYALTLITAAATVWATAAEPAVAAQVDLRGTWTETAQGNTIEIAPCAASGDTLCVRLLADRPERGQASRAGVVVAHQLTTTKPNQWRGEFVGPEGQRFPIQITLASADRFTYKVCALANLCDGGTYTRVAPFATTNKLQAVRSALLFAKVTTAMTWHPTRSSGW